jgi:hypothetical protein
MVQTLNNIQGFKESQSYTIEVQIPGREAIPVTLDDIAQYKLLSILAPSFSNIVKYNDIFTDKYLASRSSGLTDFVIALNKKLLPLGLKIINDYGVGYALSTSDSQNLVPQRAREIVIQDGSSIEVVCNARQQEIIQYIFNTHRVIDPVGIQDLNQPLYSSDMVTIERLREDVGLNNNLAVMDTMNAINRTLEGTPYTLNPVYSMKKIIGYVLVAVEG